MDGEIHNLIKVWSLAIVCLCYCFYVSSRLPKGLFRLVSLIPIFFLFIILPLNLSTIHFCGATSFFLAWLANFKLLLFAFDQGPLSPPPHNVFHFISMASLPMIKTTTKPNNYYKGTENVLPKSQNSSHHIYRVSLSLGLKVLLVAMLFQSYNYCTQHLHRHLILAMYCVHTYLETELILAIGAIPARAVFGFEIEPQFNHPYLATSLQDFWGHRWNLMVTGILRPTVYYPVRRISTRIVGPRWWVSLPGVIAVFVVSGLMHELIFYYLTRASPTWEVTWFFVLHGVAVAVEVAAKKAVPVKWWLHPVVSRPLVLGFVAVTGFWLFFPQMVRNGADQRAIREYSMLLNYATNLLPL